jgi:hypothetical protein
MRHYPIICLIQIYVPQEKNKTRNGAVDNKKAAKI